MFDSGEIADVHEPELFEVVANVGPKLVIWVASDHIIHKLKLTVQVGLHVFRSVGLSFEIEAHEVFVRGVNLCISRISFKKAGSSMLFESSDIWISIDVKFIPSSLFVSVLMPYMTKFVRLYISADFEIRVY